MIIDDDETVVTPERVKFGLHVTVGSLPASFNDLCSGGRNVVPLMAPGGLEQLECNRTIGAGEVEQGFVPNCVVVEMQSLGR